MNFYAGQKVVCISNKFDGGTGMETLPVKGAVYTIRGFDHNRARCVETVGIRLVEIVNEPRHYYGCGIDEASFAPSRFRPVKTTDISIFTKMLAPTPKEMEPA